MFSKKVVTTPTVVLLFVVGCSSSSPSHHNNSSAVDAGMALAVSRPPPPPVVQSLSPPSPCPTDMALVDGMYCPQVVQRCAEWGHEGGLSATLRCLRFSESRCVSAQRVHLRFCMDLYEGPNRPGEIPRVMITWVDAQQACRSQGRRLCTASEWTFACEGPNVHPYPYGDGMTRDDNACRIDHHRILYNPARGANPRTRAAEVRRAFEGVASGEMAQCVSWSGVHDMTGNVDEWVVNQGGSLTHPPYRSGLKGGWWGLVRDRCRPMTVAHGPLFDYYQVGYRCCEDVSHP